MGDVIRKVNFELLKELNTAPLDVKHFLGTARCFECDKEHKCVIQADLWMAHPRESECPSCGAMACIFLRPGAKKVDGTDPEEPYIYEEIWPVMRGGESPPEEEEDDDFDDA